MKGQGICKNCGNGTLNNETNPVFVIAESGDDEFVVCGICGSEHIDFTPARSWREVYEEES